MSVQAVLKACGTLSGPTVRERLFFGYKDVRGGFEEFWSIEVGVAGEESETVGRPSQGCVEALWSRDVSYLPLLDPILKP